VRNPLEHQFSEAYNQIDTLLSKLTVDEIESLAGALVGELVDRGDSTVGAAQALHEAIDGGVMGSDAFDHFHRPRPN
jgi:hypothetical protein